jgi:hypothetical protein
MLRRVRLNGGHMPVLLPRERELFFRNFLGLLSCVNDRYNLVQGFGHPEGPAGIDSDTIVTLRDKLWNDAGIIDEYIDSIWDMQAEDIQLLRSWKKRIVGTFFMFRHLKKYTVFFSDKNSALYGVTGISEPLSAMVDSAYLPLMIDTVLLPFKDRIIYDSVFSFHNISFGPGIRNSMRERYAEIKKEKGIMSEMA